MFSSGAALAKTLGSEKRPVWLGQRATGREAKIGPSGPRLDFGL